MKASNRHKLRSTFIALFALLIALYCIPSFAQYVATKNNRWEYIGTNDKGAACYLDKETIEFRTYNNEISYVLLWMKISSRKGFLWLQRSDRYYRVIIDKDRTFKNNGDTYDIEPDSAIETLYKRFFEDK